MSQLPKWPPYARKEKTHAFLCHICQHARSDVAGSPGCRSAYERVAERCMGHVSDRNHLPFGQRSTERCRLTSALHRRDGLKHQPSVSLVPLYSLKPLIPSPLHRIEEGLKPPSKAEIAAVTETVYGARLGQRGSTMRAQL
ncbi:hypothetical protein BAUCODRAFT_333298 [Baudoinia panamericana UAMH 10762]|uniref:Uncharacterized protein n=1 Tax=Baudoinia panamericana (strain UAMH 10762) TaxID=717646 RepID=M2LB40_BAUPA|nr:uncharacterized protein BAUCODRAFT_333298 [Baudoinia panamericana UAMH 10762]EMC91027.1 hypothetical protein BAUCODRAFT_333298 [Baudoinia panamericana UAMH 10762]